MTKLLHAEFFRLIKNKLFWLGLLVMVGVPLYGVGVRYYDYAVALEYIWETADGLWFVGGIYLGIVLSVFVSLFIGTEFSDGTIRNKLTAEEQEQQQHQTVERISEETNDSRATTLPIERLESFPNHRFSLYEGERLDDMVNSIKEHGVLVPLLIWAINDKRIILSGHNRAQAAKIAGLKDVPVILKENIDEAEAKKIFKKSGSEGLPFRSSRFLD